MKFIQLAKELKNGIDPVYLLEGEEIYFRDHAVKSIREALRLTQPLLNDVRIEGETLKGEKLLSFRDGLYSLPFFDEKRLVRVYGFYPTERDFSLLQSYFEKPCETTVLLIVNEKKGGVDLKKKKGVTYVDCSRSDVETISRWLFALLKKEGLIPDGDAAGLMAEYCALDAARMKREAEKLRLLLGEGGKVTRAVIEENIAKDAEYKIYELTQAASRGNGTAFFSILDDLLQKGYDENAVLSSLVSHFKTLTEVSRAQGSNEEVAQKLGMKPYPVQKDREIVSRLGRERVEALYLRLYELSCGMRGGMYSKTGALYAGIAKIFFG